MMGALPQTATFTLPLPTAAGSALPQGGGGEGSFDQIVALQAQVAAPATAQGDAAALAPATNIAKAPAALFNDTLADGEAQIETGEALTSDPAPTETDAEASGEEAVAIANQLAGTLGRFVTVQPVKTAVTTKTGEVQTASDDQGQDAAVDTVGTPLVLTGGQPQQAPASDKPAKDAPQPFAARRDETSALPMAAAKPREAAQPLPATAFMVTEPQAAKPPAEPAMTVLFTQPAAQTAGIVETARPAIVAERVLDLTSDDAWIERLATDIAATKSATGDLSFRLMPRHLGRLDVSMITGDDGVSVKLDTQHEATATIVAAAQPRLVEDLRQQGVRVAEAQVTHTPGEAGRQSQQGQGGTPGEGAAHLIETANDRADARAETRDEDRDAGRRGRFA